MRATVSHQSCWLPVPGFDRYEVSDQGQVWSSRTQSLLKGTISKGYLVVRLCKEGRRVPRPVHRLVCIAFHGPCPADKEMVGHLDGDKLNNRVGNLAWITRSENTLHSIQHGTYSHNPPPRHSMPGSSHPMAKLTEHDVSAIRERLRSGETRRPIASDYGVSLTCISGIKTGKHWSHSGYAPSPYGSRPSGECQAHWERCEWCGCNCHTCDCETGFEYEQVRDNPTIFAR